MSNARLFCIVFFWSQVLVSAAILLGFDFKLEDLELLAWRFAFGTLSGAAAVALYGDRDRSQ